MPCGQHPPDSNQVTGTDLHPPSVKAGHHRDHLMRWDADPTSTDTHVSVSLYNHERAFWARRGSLKAWNTPIG